MVAAVPLLGLMGRRRNWRPSIGMRIKTARADLMVTGREEPARCVLSVSSLDLRILMTWQRQTMLRVMTAMTGTARKKTEELHGIYQGFE